MIRCGVTFQPRAANPLAAVAPVPLDDDLPVEERLHRVLRLLGEHDGRRGLGGAQVVEVVDVRDRIGEQPDGVRPRDDALRDRLLEPVAEDADAVGGLHRSILAVTRARRAVA